MTLNAGIFQQIEGGWLHRKEQDLAGGVLCPHLDRKIRPLIRSLVNFAHMREPSKPYLEAGAYCFHAE
jgi:hypothetical protein